MITSADVLLIAPELTAITSSQWTAIINDVYLQIDPLVWGTKADLGAKYLAAHYATLTYTNGLVITRKVGEVAETYVNPMGRSARETLLALTKYGTVFLNLSLQLPDRWIVL